MAAVTNILWLNSYSIPQGIVDGDTITAPGTWTFTGPEAYFSGDVYISGSLDVTGSITSGSQLNATIYDTFIDLAFGRVSTTPGPGGLTINGRRAVGFVIGNVTNFPAFNQFVYSDAGGSTPLQVGDIVCVTGLPAALASNEGYFAVLAVSGGAFPQTITVEPAPPISVPFVQNTFTVAVPVPPGIAYKLDLAVLTLSDGIQFPQDDGTPWPAGLLVYAYVPNATVAAFQGNGVYELAGEATLQSAYDNGNTITTDGPDIAFTLANGDFTVNGPDSVLVGQTTAVERFGVQAGATGIDLESSTGPIDVGTSAVLLPAPVGTQTIQFAATAPPTVDQFFVQPNGFLQSPNWPAAYPLNTDGLVIFSGIAGVSRTISGITNTESGFDFLRVYAGAGSAGPLLYQVSGLAQPFSFSSATGQTFTVRFNSDNSIPAAGFNLTVTGTATQSVNIGTGISRETVIGSTAAVSVSIEAPNLAISASASPAYIQIGTGADTKTITLGSTALASATIIEGASGGINIGVSSVPTGAINIATGTSSRVVNIGTGASPAALNIGTSTSTGRSITIGSGLGTTSVTMQNGSGGFNIATLAASGALSIGTGASAISGRAITFGSLTNLQRTIIQGGTGVGATPGLSIATGTTGQIVIGGSPLLADTATGSIFIAGSTGARSVNIGTGTAASQAINVGTGAAVKTTTVGSTNTTSATTVQAGSGNVNLAANGGQVISTANVMLNAASGGLFVQADVGLNLGNIVVIEGTTNPANPLVPRVKLADANAGTELSERFFAGVVTPATIGAGSTGTIASMYGTPVGINFVGGGQPTAPSECGQPVYLSTTPGLATMTAPAGSGDAVYRIGFLISSTAITALRFGVLLAPQFINVNP